MGRGVRREAWRSGGVERSTKRALHSPPNALSVSSPYRPRDQGMQLFMCPVEHPVKEVRKLDHRPTAGQQTLAKVAGGTASLFPSVKEKVRVRG